MDNLAILFRLARKLLWRNSKLILRRWQCSFGSVLSTVGTISKVAFRWNSSGHESDFNRVAKSRVVTGHVTIQNFHLGGYWICRYLDDLIRMAPEHRGAEICQAKISGSKTESGYCSPFVYFGLPVMSTTTSDGRPGLTVTVIIFGLLKVNCPNRLQCTRYQLTSLDLPEATIPTGQLGALACTLAQPRQH